MAPGRFDYLWAEAAGRVESPGCGRPGRDEGCSPRRRSRPDSGWDKTQQTRVPLFIREKQVRSYRILTGVNVVNLVNVPVLNQTVTSSLLISQLYTLSMHVDFYSVQTALNPHRSLEATKKC